MNPEQKLALFRTNPVTEARGRGRQTVKASYKTMKPSERVNILVVDDQPDQAMSIESTLAELDQNVVTGLLRARGTAMSVESRLCGDSARREHAGDGWL